MLPMHFDDGVWLNIMVMPMINGWIFTYIWLRSKTDCTCLVRSYVVATLTWVRNRIWPCVMTVHRTLTSHRTNSIFDLRKNTKRCIDSCHKIKRVNWIMRIFQAQANRLAIALFIGESAHFDRSDSVDTCRYIGISQRNCKFSELYHNLT